MTFPIIFSTTEKLIEDVYEYRGEGNLHLALSLRNSKQIMLITKNTLEDTMKQQEQSICFHNEIMKILLQPFVSKVQQVSLNIDQLEQIEKNILSQRPSFRLCRSLSNHAALMQDYTRTNFPVEFNDIATISFEIKPKSAIDIDEKCRYCWKQNVKLNIGRIEKQSNYCPKNLYASNSEQVEGAILALLENPQNNLQIYENSNLIYSENEMLENIHKHFNFWNSNTVIKNICSLLARILLYEFNAKDECEKCKYVKFTILNRLVELQKLDASSKPPSSNENGYVEYLLLKLNADKNVVTDNICRRCKVMDFLDIPLVKHYISRIARDCSIIISVKQIPKNTTNVNGFHVVEVDDIKFMFDIKVLDLFPKKEK